MKPGQLADAVVARLLDGAPSAAGVPQHVSQALSRVPTGADDAEDAMANKIRTVLPRLKRAYAAELRRTDNDNDALVAASDLAVDLLHLSGNEAELCATLLAAYPWDE